METNVRKNDHPQDMSLIRQEDHLQMISIDKAKLWYDQFAEFTKSILKKDLDYGVIPGTPKPSLLKAGAEKLRFAYGLGIEFDMIDKTIDFDRPFVDYTYRCTVRSKQGQILSQCEGNCNSMEAKFGYLWLSISELPEGTDITKLRCRSSGKKLSEFDFAINKAETSGQYGKPPEYWNKWKEAIANKTARKIKRKAKAGREMDAWEIDETQTVYRVINPDVVGMKNTIMKMAQKRAFVGAVLLATGASEYFTQDVEDMEINGVIHTNDKPVEDIQEAEIIEEEKSDEEIKPTVEPKVIPGLWYEMLEKCVTPADVDDLAVKNKATLVAFPELKQLFKQKKFQLLKAKEDTTATK